MYGYVYKFTLIPTNKIYVGKRKAETFDQSYFGSGKKWKPLVEQYGKENVKREILEWCDSAELLESREKFWIDKLDSRNPEIGYNISKGGKNPILCGQDNPMYGKVYTEDRRIKQSNSLKEGYRNGRINPSSIPENANKIRKALIGHTVSEETRKKLSEANKNKISITNGTIMKWCLPKDFQYWEEQGFYKVPKKKRLCDLSEEELSEHRDLVHLHRSEATSGKNNGRYGDHRIWITNGVQNKQIKNESELINFPGYHRGKCEPNKNYKSIWVSNDLEEKLIDETLYNEFVKNHQDFHKGRLRKK